MQNQLKGGEILTEIMKQEKDSPIRMEAQVLIFYAYTKKFLHELTIPEVNVLQVKIFDFINARHPEAMVKLREKKDYDDEMAKAFDADIKVYVEEVIKARPKEDDEETEGGSVGVDMLDKATSKKAEPAKK